MMKKTRVLFYLTFFLIIFGATMTAGQKSPCPNVFEYNFDKNTNYLYGIIKALTPRIENNRIRLHVQITVGNRIEDNEVSKGEITFLGKYEDILQNRPLYYNLRLPTWVQVPPKINDISINGFQICRGDYVNWTSPIAIVDLTHDITISFNGNAPPINSYPFDNRMSFTNYKYNFNPTIPLNQNNFGVSSRDENSFEPPVYNASVINDLYVPQQDQNVNLNNNCGSSVNIIGLIAYGVNAAPNKHPWICGLFKRTSVTPTFLCGANLISKKHVLTAAHCVTGLQSNELWLVFGRNAIYDWFDKNSQTRQIATVYINSAKGKLKSRVDVDIALMVLSQEIEFNQYVQPICLWTGSNDLKSLIGVNGTVVGWGIEENGRKVEKLKQVVVPVVSNEICIRSHPFFGQLISDRTFCAGLKNYTGPCNGDSGSGFYVNNKGVWMLRGIVSHSLTNPKGICDLRYYTVFVDVAKHNNWILSHMS